MYRIYTRRSRRLRFFSSFIPLVLILVVGGFIGNRIIQNSNKGNETILGEANQIANVVQNETKNENENTIINNIENSITDNNIENSVNSNTSGNNDNNVINEDKPNDNKTEDNKTDDNTIKNNNKVKFDSSVAFIGDSRTQGFIMYNGLKEVEDYSYIGLMVDTAITKEFIKTNDGNKITLLQDMKNKKIDRVYIMLGVNELGWSYPQVFKTKYKELIDEIRKVKPECKIYVQSIIPMTKSKSDADKIYNNKNVAKFNKLVQEVAEEKNVTYLDVKSVLVNKDGCLPEEASSDGVHVNKAYCEKWLDYLKNNS